MRHTRWHRPVLIVMGAYFVSKESFQNGNFAQGIILAIATIIGTTLFIKLFDYFWPHLGYFKPFEMDFTEEHLRGPYSKKLKKIKIGEPHICLRVGPRIGMEAGMEFRGFHLRLVEKSYSLRFLKNKRLWEWEDLKGDKITIEGVEEQSATKEPLGIQQNKCRKDGKGGFVVHLEHSLSKVKGEHLWLKVKVKANGECKGQIRFESNVGKIRRGHVQLPIEVITPPASDTEGSQTQ
jgi:hypothetical protein